jgi:hypothetical protein
MMNESKFSVTKGARVVAMLFVFLAALAALQAFGAKPVSADPQLPEKYTQDHVKKDVSRPHNHRGFIALVYQGGRNTN